MKTSTTGQESDVRRFRTKLQLAMMLVVSAITALGLYLVQGNVASQTEQALEREFQAELAALHNAQEVRYAALVERCRALLGKSRIHAALEDNALDLLYLSAQDEFRDLMAVDGVRPPDQAPRFLHANFYRFLDTTGALIPPTSLQHVGDLPPEEEAQLVLPAVPERPQNGYLFRKKPDPEQTINEIIAMPIYSKETGDVIAAVVLGFKPVEFAGAQRAGIRRGIWVKDRLHLPGVPEEVQNEVGQQVSNAIRERNARENSFRIELEKAAHLLFYKRLNPESLYPPAYEVCIYPLSGLLARQSNLQAKVLGAGAFLLFGGLVASHVISRRLSKPVEKLAVTSAEDRARRAQAEAALESTSEELHRAERFSADASHQLKTPVTVLRAGLEELQQRQRLPREVRDEISALIHQTFRITSIIEDLLLLSRMDAGRLQLEFSPVDLTLLVESWLDDHGVFPEDLNLEIQTDLPPALRIEGEKRYTALILQNLLENARKYNLPGGRIRIAARVEGDWVFVTIGNTSKPIAAGVRERIFERFHRGAIGENVPGYGLGLSLARELARIHGGDLRLLPSEAGWTEFELKFRLAKQSVPQTVPLV